MWKRFAEVAVEREYEVEEKDYFANYAGLSWAMTKAKYEGPEFWQFI